MSDYLKLSLVPICGLLVILSLIIMYAFRRLIGRGDEMTVEQISRTKLFATSVLIIVIISLMFITLYIFMRLRMN